MEFRNQEVDLLFTRYEISENLALLLVLKGTDKVEATVTTNGRKNIASENIIAIKDYDSGPILTKLLLEEGYITEENTFSERIGFGTLHYYYLTDKAIEIKDRQLKEQGIELATIPSTTFVRLLNDHQIEEIERAVRKALQEEGLVDELEEDVERALDSRICNLEDTIDIYNLKHTKIK